MKDTDKTTQEKEFRQKLKVAFRTYSGPTRKFVQIVTGLGFSIILDRKHVILTICMNGQNYQFVTSRTPSDSRAGLNVSSYICRKLFNENY